MDEWDEDQLEVEDQIDGESGIDEDLAADVFGDEDEEGEDQWEDRDDQNEDEIEEYSDLEPEADGETPNGRTNGKSVGSDQVKAQNVRGVQAVWRELTDMFHSTGRSLFDVNRMASFSSLPHFMVKAPSLSSGMLSSKLGFLSLINDLQELRAQISTSDSVNSFSPIADKLSTLQVKSTKRQGRDSKIENIILNSQINTEEIWKYLESGFQKRKAHYKDVSESWFTKTSIQSATTDKTALAKLKLMQGSPFQSAEAAMNEPGKLLEKSRRKVGVYRVLGKEEAEISNLNSAEIYEDPDILMDLNRDRTDNVGDNRQGKFVHPYEEQRRAHREKELLLGKRVTKDKAIKFVEHEKLVGFMSGTMYDEEVEGRDSIVASLFGIRQNKPHHQLDHDIIENGGKHENTKRKHLVTESKDEDDIAIF